MTMGLAARTARTRALRRRFLISSSVAPYESGKPASEGGAVKRASSRVRPRAKRLSVSRGAGGFNFDDFLAGTKLGVEGFIERHGVHDFSGISY